MIFPLALDSSASAQILVGSPTNLTATAISSSQINLSWTAPSGSVINGYKIERSTNDGSTWSTIASNTGNTSTTYSDTGLVASTTYTYRVSTIGLLGTSSPSNTASATTNAPPLDSTFTSLTLNPTSINTGGQTTITATVSDTNTQTKTPTGTVTFSDGSAGGTFSSASCNTSGNNLVCSTLYTAPNTAGTVTITGSYGGDSTHSTSSGTAPLTVATKTTVPQPPTGLSATAISSSQINLSWIAPSSNGGSSIIGYNVYRGTTSGRENSTPIATDVTSTTYNDTGLTNSQTYYYTVTAVNSVGESPKSNEASATPTANSTVPSDPQNLQATGGNTKVSLSWDAPSSNGGSSITGYNAYRGTTSGSESSTPIATGITSTSYSDTSVTNGQAYYYYVTAVNSVGTSNPSNEASATPTAPPPPGGITLNNVQSTSGTTSSSNQMTISSFNAGSGSNQLLVVGISANSQGTTSVTFNSQPLIQTVLSFNNNDAEFWYLKNPNGTGNIIVTFGGQTQAVVGAYSFANVNQTSPIANTATNYNTASSSPSISITTKYPNDWVLDLPSIYGGKTLSSPTCTQEWNTNIPSAITGASSSDTVASPSSVTCGWTASNGGDLWDDVAVEVRAASTSNPTAPSSPTDLTATAGNSQVSLSWTAPTNNGGSAITGYNVYRGTTSGGETNLISVSASQTSYTDTSVTNGIKYYYEVTAVNAVGESSKSSETSAMPQTTATAPSPPTGLTATATSSSQINLSWIAPSNNGGSAITGYEVERAQGDLSFGGFSNSTNTTFFARGNTTSFNDSGLTSSTTYNYTVFAKNSVGHSSSSNAASATTQSTTSGPHITLDVNSANIGTDISITGTGFTPQTQIAVSQDNYGWAFNDTNDAPSPSTIKSDSNGNFVAVVEVEHTVTGQHTISAKDSSGKMTTATITITPHVSMYPTSGHAGTQVLIPDSQGNGFAANSAIAITFDGQTITPSSPMSTDSSGDFYQDTFTVPTNVSLGQHTITFSDNKGNSYSIPFDVTSSSTPMYSLHAVASGINEPDRMAFIPDNGPGVDGSGTFMVLEKNTGNVWVYKNTNSGFVKQPVAFVTVPNLQTGAEDNGLLGIAIDPNWASSSNPSKWVYFYVTRTVNGNVMGEVIRYHATTDSSGNIIADTSVGEQNIINIPNWQDGHNGGCIRFGPSDNLYIEVSDGWEFSVHSQDLSSLQGKILRITPVYGTQVNGQWYTIPSTNPFASSTNSAIRKEIWSYGVRNGYSFDVDWKTGMIYDSIVGYNTWEEIENFTTPGLNEGWAYYESSPNGNPDNLTNYKPSIYWYPHEGIESNTAQPEGIEAIVGGVFYHGTYYPNLDGSYLFADYGVHFISALLPTSIASPQMDPASDIPKSQSITLYEDTSIVPDDLEVWNGQVYMVDLRGQIYVLDYGTPNLSNQGCTASSCPTGLVATATSSSQINLSWKAPTSTGDLIAGYKIERATGSGNWITLVSNTGTSTTTYDDTGLAASTIYTYRVSAINGTGTSQPSNTATATTLCGPCTLQVSTKLTTDEIVSGYYTYLLNSTGTMIQSGFTPNTFYLNKGSQYSVGIDGYDTFVFDHWLDNNSTQNPRGVSITSNTQLTAILRDTKPLILNPNQGPAGTVVTASENHVFKSGNSVTIKYDGATINTTPSSISANSTGGFTATITVPVGSIGPHEVSATNGTNTHYAQFQDTAGTA